MALSSTSLLESSLFFLFFNVSLALKDTISLNQPINGSQKLTSKGGKFELGFFTPGFYSTYYYLGIWYGFEISWDTVVWVANRETPLAEISQTTLAISENGNLVLSNQTHPTIWSTNITPNTLTAVVAVLLDTGNLVLRDASNPNVTLWQSFDHPTHVWLPGSKIGLNKVTKQLQRLTSWRDEDDPSPGYFNLEIDPNGTSQLVVVRDNSFTFSTSGTWNGHTFSMNPSLAANYIFDFDYISNEKENYFTYMVKSDNPFTAMIIMDISGQIKQWVAGNGWTLSWSETQQQCDVGAFHSLSGVSNQAVLPVCKCIREFIEKSRSDWAWSYWAACVRNT